MRYFGTRHNAPVYGEIEAMRTPAGESCARCEKQITEDDDGFEVPYAEHAAVGTMVYFHRRCFLASLFGPGEAL